MRITFLGVLTILGVVILVLLLFRPIRGKPPEPPWGWSAGR